MHEAVVTQFSAAAENVNGTLPQRPQLAYRRCIGVDRAIGNTPNATSGNEIGCESLTKGQLVGGSLIGQKTQFR